MYACLSECVCAHTVVVSPGPSPYRRVRPTSDLGDSRTGPGNGHQGVSKTCFYS